MSRFRLLHEEYLDKNRKFIYLHKYKNGNVLVKLTNLENKCIFYRILSSIKLIEENTYIPDVKLISTDKLGDLRDIIGYLIFEINVHEFETTDIKYSLFSEYYSKDEVIQKLKSYNKYITFKDDSFEISPTFLTLFNFCEEPHDDEETVKFKKALILLCKKYDGDGQKATIKYMDYFKKNQEDKLDKLKAKALKKVSDEEVKEYSFFTEEEHKDLIKKSPVKYKIDPFILKK